LCWKICVVDGGGGFDLGLQAGGLGHLAGDIGVFGVQKGFGAGFAVQAVRLVEAAHHQGANHAFFKLGFQGRHFAFQQHHAFAFAGLGRNLHFFGQVKRAVIEQRQV
jgi:hypothetical protein